MEIISHKSKDTKLGYSVSRRNGKMEVVAIRVMYCLLNGKNITYGA